MKDFKVGWEEAKEVLRKELAEKTFEIWIADLVPISFKDDFFTFGVSNDFFAEYLELSYGEKIVEYLCKSLGKDTVKLKYEVIEMVNNIEKHEELLIPKDKSSIEKTDIRKNVLKMREFRKDSDYDMLDSLGHRNGLNPNYTFENFVIGDSNKFCHTVCTAVSKEPGTHYNPLFIYGGVGLGKTHIAQAIAQEISKTKPKARVECLSSEEFLNIYVDAMANRKESKFRSYFRNLDVLVIDDVQFFKDKNKFQEEFFHTFNTLYNNHKQIVLTSDKPPHELDGLEKRLVSRFECGVSAEVNVPDVETRAAILKQKQQNQQIKLSNDIIFYLAERIKTNVRRLEGALSKLICYASLRKEEITINTVNEILGSMFEEEICSDLTVERIMRITAEHFEVRISDITGSNRQKKVMIPRQVAMFLARKLTNLSSPEIGDAFGKNHATILHAVQKVEKDSIKDEQFGLLLNKLERMLKKND